MPAPSGYRKLPVGVKCRCLLLWKEGADWYCCTPEVKRQNSVWSRHDHLREAAQQKVTLPKKTKVG